MKRIFVMLCLDYCEKIEVLGFDFYGDYWCEEVYYCFMVEEIVCLEEVINEVYCLYCEVV